MSWQPNDLVSDVDLLAYERTILTQFDALDWKAKRQKALEDWLFPSLASAGFNPYRLRTRYQAETVLGHTSGTYTDYTAESRDASSASIPLGAVLAASSDGLYIGAEWQFRGVSIRMLDDVSATSATLTVEVWRDAWVAVAVDDGTRLNSGVPFGKGGAITWTVPEDWVERPLNDSRALYWARVRASAAPASAVAGQIGVIRRSALCAPVTYRTLAYIYREALAQQDGPWEGKAQQYLEDSEAAWLRVQSLLGMEFDTITPDDQIDATEAVQTAEAASGGGRTWDRA